MTNTARDAASERPLASAASGPQALAAEGNPRPMSTGHPRRVPTESQVQIVLATRHPGRTAHSQGNVLVAARELHPGHHSRPVEGEGVGPSFTIRLKTSEDLRRIVLEDSSVHGSLW